MDLVEVTRYRPARSRADLDLRPGETLVAGGTWLFSEPQPGTTGLVDVTTLGWPPWEYDASGLRVAATCTVAELLAVPADRLGHAAALVRECAEALLMSFKVQACATVGGNICLALPAGAMTSLFSALDAVAVVWSPDGTERRQPVSDLVQDVRRTTLAPGEVLRHLDVPTAALVDTRYVTRRVSLAPLGRSATVVTAAAREGTVTLSVTASLRRPVVLPVPDPRGDVVAWLADALDAVDLWWTDAHGARDWRRAMTLRLAAEAVAEVLG